MDTDTLFRLIFAFLVIVILGTRLYGHLKADTFKGERRSYDEGVVTYIMRPLSLLIGIGSILYIAAPQLMAWSSLDLPLWLRWLALPLGLLVIAGMAWVQTTLSKNFSGQLGIRDDQTLITSGPYHWVRHPMYTAVTALFIAVFLLTANWFIGLGGLATVLPVIVTRTPKEEAMLVEAFGEAYREYMKRTPRYLPRLGMEPPAQPVHSGD
ncbi:MAG TPA: isoprenylcysteine carboxylmethyltransferase family protein [Phototrophicaceae bacterium]|jgi:protein-S-isoprenylcysteine O-methyltransferase Ste14|nr:isoprenylcysteine carboxylmethyltransferase family protein [Phototrophicaceae bacterium]